MNNPRQFLLTGLFLAATVLSARAGSFTANFDSGALPPGSHTNANVNGGAFLELTGGVGNSGCLKLTKNINSQNGSFVLDDLDNGNPIYGFEATFKIRIGGGSGTPADGMAFCVAPDFTDTTIFGETGAGAGVRVTWGVYTGSGQNPPDPAIRIRTGDTVVAYKGYSVAGMRTGGTDPSTWWADCRIRLSPDGAMSMDYQGVNIFTNFYVPGYENLVNSGAPMRFAFGARTGGLNENFWIDDLQITTYTTSQVGFRQQPFSQKVQQGDTILLEAQVGNNNGVTLQWMSNNVAIPGANFPILTITNVQPSLSGSKYKMVATGPNNTATSTEATLTVINLTLPTPQMSFNFNDGLTPAGVTLTGTAIVDSFGGIGDSACLKLVNPIGTAAMLVADPAPTTTLYGFTARFKLLVGGGSVPPADGAVFAFGTDIPNDPTGEFERGQGLGTGLRVAFDIYNNDLFGYNGVEGQQPAPSIDVRFGNQVLGSVQLPLSFMESGLNEFFMPDYMDVIIQLNPDATLNVVYHGALVFENLPVPAFGSFGASTNSTGSRFALAARTGSLNDNFWVDNFELSTVTTSSDTRIVQQPVAQTVLVNRPANFTFGVNDPTGVSFQWFRNGAVIAGATASTYTIPATVMGDSGVLFKAQATKGPINLLSDEVGLTVVNLTAPTTPNVSYNFDNGTVPAGTAVYGTGENGGPAGG
ncbi:MAG TPA: hypothetical protein VN673_09420, partial [Clostridia bacterium]|nr:hypothetical protein [Clostridia bacterium]